MAASLEAAVAFPLTVAATNRAFRVANVHGTDAYAKRLADLGLVRGAQVLVASAGAWGVLLHLNGCAKLAVDKYLAEHIWVEEA